MSLPGDLNGENFSCLTKAILVSQNDHSDYGFS